MFGLGALALAACAPAAPAGTSAPGPAAADTSADSAASAGDSAGDAVPRLPSSERWRRHLDDDLLRFWLHPEALGRTPGDFPTFRCNDGRVYRADAPCPELAEAPPWLSGELGVEYTRMKSRQTFAYGVGFHITGDPALLAHARAGVDFLRRRAYEPTGTAVSYWKDGVAGPPADQRTTQDLAYAQVGLAFFYYLTRDPEVLADLVRLEQHIFDRYWDPDAGMLRWVLAAGPGGEPDQQELVAQLDQINAYLLLVAPLITDPATRERWLSHLHALSQIVRERFYAPAHNLFWGAVHAPERMRLGAHHTDFGHSAKSLWMLYLSARLADDHDQGRFTKRAADALIARAVTESGCWAAGVREDGALDRFSNWWTAAELDQLAATVALIDRTTARYLAKSYDCWLERFVDPGDHGVWPFVAPAGDGDEAEAGGPKVFHWKNGYHEFEHVLVALITTAALRGEPLTLHYAFRERPASELIQPYYFRADIAAEAPLPLPGVDGLAGTSVTFTDLR